MKTFSFCLVVALLISLSSAGFFSEKTKDVTYQEQIKVLQGLLEKQRYSKEQEFKYFPPQFYEKKGLYSANIHQNMMDKNNTYPFHLFRQYVGFPDSNVFVTSFVLSALLDCVEYGTITIDQDKFEESIDALLDFRDKNQEDGVPSYAFWPQEFKNGTWYQSPKNLNGLANIMKHTPNWFKQFLTNVGLTFLVELDKVVDIFHFPADTDDSSANIGIRMMNSPHIRQSIKDKWYKHNNNLEQFYHLLKKYSYKPFDQTNSSVSTVDMRNYFAFHEYLSQQANSSTNFSLFTTWIKSTDDQINLLEQIPENTNNFDCTVLSNAIYGINEVIFNSNSTNKDIIFDEQLQGHYLNASSTIIYAIENSVINDHPDISILYYPSVYAFYTFVARNVNFLNSNYDRITIDVVKQVADGLNSTMKNYATNLILNQTLINKQGDIYWESFLGVYANKTYNEDTTFSTLMVLNTLVDTWTITKKDKNGKSQRFYDPYTPLKVKETIQKGIKSLLKKDSFSKSNENAFFSTSIKSYTTKFFYPMNVHTDMNGTPFDPHTTQEDILYQITGVKGAIHEDDYAELLKQKWFQHDTEQVFQGFNSVDSAFPYWSAPAITYSLAMSLFSKYQSIEQ